MKRGQFYIPGDTWIYYKIYLMPGLSDPFLVRVMYPKLCRFYQEKKIRLWYFIRYTDPDFHLRIRIRLESTDHLTPVLKAVRKELHPWLQKGKIKNVQLDTYQREYDHYGSHTIQWFEELFFHDSVAIAMLLTNLDLDNDGEQFSTNAAVTTGMP